MFAKRQSVHVQNALQSIAGSTAVEVGPGVGHCALFAHHAGLDYTTIDLPLGIVAQACFLGRAAGPGGIWMAGDRETPTSEQIKLFSVAELPTRSFDVALNVDSMTEMSLQAALSYIGWISRHARLFLSINHEQNPFTVADIMECQSGIVCIERSPWTPRDGYFQELFRVDQIMRYDQSALLRLRTREFFSRAYGATRWRLINYAATRRGSIAAS